MPIFCLYEKKQFELLRPVDRPWVRWDLSADYERDPEATDRDIETVRVMPAIAEVV